MNTRGIVLLSIICNAGLIGWALHLHQNPRPAVGSAVQTDPGRKQSDPPIQTATRTNVRLETLTITNHLSHQFTWHKVESSDYKAYIANLRALGCPEETIRDIIIADVDKLFGPRLAAFRPKQEEHQFWKTGQSFGSSYNQTPEQRKQSRDVYQEKQALLKELLGEDYQKEMARQFGYAAEEDSFMAGLPKEKKEQAQKIHQEFNEKRSEIYAKAKGYISTDVQDDLKVLNRQMSDELAKVLTPQELFEYQVRTSEIASNMKHNELQMFDATEMEFRAIFKAKQEVELLQQGDGQLNAEWQAKISRGVG